MNEASSKFVDNLALERLIGDKLSKVSHSPRNSRFNPKKQLFQHWEKCHLEMATVTQRENGNARWFEIPSFEKSASEPENNTIYLDDFPATAPVANILLVHGLYDDNKFNYAYLIRLLNDIQFNVFGMVLPYHHQRKPAASLFSGEYFLSADLYRTQNALKQTVYDIEASLQWIGQNNPLPTILVGFSMGGALAFRYDLLQRHSFVRARGTFLVNPVTDLIQIIVDNPLFVTVRRDLEHSGVDPAICAELFQELDPCENLGPDFDPTKLAVVYSCFDQIVGEPKNQRFIARTGIQNVRAYHAGHLNILRVPKLAADIRGFLQNNV